MAVCGGEVAVFGAAERLQRAIGMGEDGRLDGNEGVGRRDADIAPGRAAIVRQFEMYLPSDTLVA